MKRGSGNTMRHISFKLPRLLIKIRFLVGMYSDMEIPLKIPLKERKVEVKIPRRMEIYRI